ncbi:MAG: GntR family transcriptional regulator [Clostridia bacterium]|nr:GntR family transcriptional regulator [Clostridia bacterium]
MFKIDLKSNLPIYEQIINQINECILKGYFKSGDALPSVRKLSIMLDVNPNTIAKAYTELERRGIIVTVRGKGTFISDETNSNIDIHKELNKIRPVLAELKLNGASDNEILNCVKELLNALEEKE